MGSIGIFLTTSAYKESPHCYFPFLRTDLPMFTTHSYESRISSFFVKQVCVPLKVTGKIFDNAVSKAALLKLQ